MSLIEHLREGLACGASDWHWSVGQRCGFRVMGEMRQSPFMPTGEMFAGFLQQIGAPDMKPLSHSDFSFQFEGNYFRANTFFSQGIPSVVFRHIVQSVVSLEKRGAPLGFRQLIEKQHGLILVTGPTGSGKTATLASAIDQINSSFSGHIITLEDPIEVRHTSKQCIVRQRELGTDFATFADGINNALREDPDVILVGEMRNFATVEAALSASETGHLVFGTLHTGTAPGAINRILDISKDYQPEHIKSMLAANLLGVLAQRLITDRRGQRVAAFEFLLGTVGVANLIRQGKQEMLADEIARGRREGMIGMDESLLQLVQSQRISPEIALSHALRPDELKQRLTKS